jgi:hypothetical protein
MPGLSEALQSLPPPNPVWTTSAFKPRKLGLGEKTKPAFALPLDLKHSVYPGWSKPRSIR